MSGKSTIEWIQNPDGTKGRTWNPTTGCDHVSPGCDNCYADQIATRFAGSAAFPNGFKLTVQDHRLNDPLRWNRPTRVFVDSMSDLFHRDVPDDFIAQVFRVMGATSKHTYMLLTKRAREMCALLNRSEFARAVMAPYRAGVRRWPIPNVWLGVSVENQRYADLRIPQLLETPAAIRFLSCEPLLGPVDLRGGGWSVADLDWVIIGGESGRSARPMDPAWARALVAQCTEAGVPCFVKQLGTSLWGDLHKKFEEWPEELQVRQWPEG